MRRIQVRTRKGRPPVATRQPGARRAGQRLDAPHPRVEPHLVRELLAARRDDSSAEGAEDLLGREREGAQLRGAHLGVAALEAEKCVLGPGARTTILLAPGGCAEGNGILRAPS